MTLEEIQKLWGESKCGRSIEQFTFDVLSDNIRKLENFKNYVHTRLDFAGIEKDPESVHKEHGCRIGGRLDIVLSNFKTISFLKRDIEKRIEELEQIALVSDSWHSVDIQISECKYFLELIETVEP